MIRKIVPAVLAAAFALSAIAAAAADPQVSDFDRWCENLDAGPLAATSLLFSPQVGVELDADERERYGVFGRTEGFVSARLPVDAEGRVRLEMTIRGLSGPYDVERKLTPKSLRLTRLHFYFCERYFDLEPPADGRLDEAEMLWRLALRFGATSRYGLCEAVLDELRIAHTGSGAGRQAALLLPEVRALRLDRQLAVWDRPRTQGEGSNDLKLFGGYYGLWLGLATPLAMESESPEAYGIGLITGGPLGYLTAAWACRKWDISEGDATMIQLGGDLGTWQGLGWAAEGSGDAGSVVSAGVLGGLAGIGAASWLTSKYEFSEGHAALTSSALGWGAWFGLVASSLSDDEFDDGWDTHKSMMIGADALILTTGILARNAEMSEKRVRLITLNGIIGGVMGAGLDLIIQPDDGDDAVAIIGLCSAMGLAAGFRLTHNVDNDRGDLPDEFGMGTAGRPDFTFPQISVQPNRMTGRGAMPAVGAGLTF